MAVGNERPQVADGTEADRSITKHGAGRNGDSRPFESRFCNVFRHSSGAMLPKTRKHLEEGFTAKIGNPYDD